MGTAPIATDKSPEEILSQIASFFAQIIISLLAYGALVLILDAVNPLNMPAIITTLLVFAVAFTVAYLLHMNGRKTEAPSIWIAGVVWILMVTVYVLELPTGPGKCENCTAMSKIGLTLFDMVQGSNLMNGAGRLIGTWPALTMIGYAMGASRALKRHLRG
jgi:lysylphosphatidylglycerol synthetase-like protein (DUF2156 family)